jgi:excisionase family DNA binding protein
LVKNRWWLPPDLARASRQGSELTVAQVYRLMQLGRLPTHGPRKTARQLLLSDVGRYRDRGEAITVREAAKLLRCSPDQVRELIADGQLTAEPGARRPVYITEVQALAAANRTDEPRARRRRRRPPPPGYLGTPAAAELLGRSASGVRALADRGRIPALRDEYGTYWYNPVHLEMVRRAWLAAAANDRGDEVDPRNPIG